MSPKRREEGEGWKKPVQQSVREEEAVYSSMCNRETNQTVSEHNH